MKKGKRLLCGALALLLVLSLTAVGTVQRAYATKSEEDQAAEEQKKAEEAAQRQAEMDELERKKQEKKDRIAELQKQIADAKSKKEDVIGTKTLLDQRNQLLMEEIDDTKAQIDLYAEQIQVYQEMEEEQYALFCQQVRSEEERGSLSYWSVLFKATSISDLLSRLEFVNEVAEYDRSLMEAIRQTRENIKTEKAAMEEQEQLLAQQQDELQKKVDEAAALIAEYAATQKGYEELAAAGVKMKYLVGTMIEIPRAALTADEIAKEAEFFSFGTNDLTQMTFGFSRDDAGKFLGAYYDKKIYESDPFAKLDQIGVGKLVKMAAKLGRETRPELHLGICGEHGGDPSSVEFCHKVGLDYVSCSPFRVPIARLAAAQAAIKDAQ